MTDAASNSTQRGDADVALVFLIFIGVVALIAFLATDGINRASCEDYGKVRLFGKVYDCKPEPKR